MADLRKALEVDPCDEKSLSDKLKSLYQDFNKEVRDTVLELSNNFFGPFILTFFTIITQVSSAAVMNLASFIASAIGGAVIGGLIAMVNLSLSFVNGVEIMLKYLAAKALLENLRIRKKFIKALRSDILALLELLEALQTLNIQADTIFTDDITQALPFVKRAALIVGNEKGKVTADSPIGFTSINSNAPVNTEQLNLAVDQINRAISALTGNVEVDALFSKNLKDLNKRYGIVFKSEYFDVQARVPNPLGVVGYFQDAVDQLRVKYTENGELSPEGRRIVRNYIVDFLKEPRINPFLRDYASTLFLKTRIESLGERLPVRSYILANLGKKGAKKLLDANGLDTINDSFEAASDWRDTARDKINSVFEYLNVSPNNPVVTYPTEKFTSFASVTQAVQASQASVLLQDDWLTLLRAESSLVKTFLSPALNNLQSVKQGLERAQAEGINSETLKDKVQWIAQLTSAKTFIQTTSEPEISFGGGSSFTPFQIQEQFKRSQQIYDELTNQITDRTLEEDSSGEFQEKPRTADTLLDTADQYLATFFLGPAAMFNVRSRQNVISGLQSLRFNLNDISQKDNQEIFLCEEFIRRVEANPIFRDVIKPSWNAFIESLNEVPILEGVLKGLKEGDMSRLVNAVSTAKYITEEVTEVAECVSKRSSSNPELERQAEALSTATGTSKGKTLSFLEDSQNKITALKAKLAKLESLEEIA